MEMVIMGRANHLEISMQKKNNIIKICVSEKYKSCIVMVQFTTN